MATIFVTIGLMAFLMLMMGVGLLRGRALRGSCGGVGSEDCFCAKEGTPNACDNPPENGPQVQVWVTDENGVMKPGNLSP